MLTSKNWLNEYVTVDESPVEIEKILTMSGTKVETIEKVNDVVDGMKIGQITKIEKHPQADRLQVCTVDIGEEEPLTIITSATNVFEGAKVPVAVSGSTIANGTVMEDTEFRGINSQGMFCSVEEMGLDPGLFAKEITEGIYILPEDAVLGEDPTHLMWVDDDIIDIELTANRGDCQSIYGIAREAAAAFGRELRPLDLSVPEGNGEKIEDFLKVQVDTPLCPRYTARMFRVNKIEPSPLWMQRKLLNSGVRPINNIVDVTNYVMLETGQPLHSFDYRGIGTDTIAIRTDIPQDTFTTLDGTERKITPSMMMITNGEEPIAVAGVMGGLNSEIVDDTELIVLESACFDKASVRLTAKDLNLRTEAASRYIKGINPELAREASDRAAHLYAQIGAADMLDGIIDIDQADHEPVKIYLDTDWLNHFIGVELSLEEIIDYLKKLYMEVEILSDHELEVLVPPYRLDLRLREDLAEEVARLYGYDRIPMTIMGGETTVGERTPEQKFEKEIRTLLIDSGAYQTSTSSFISPNRLGPLAEDIDNAVEIINPLGEENAWMRPTLLGHQLEVVALNKNHNNPAGTFFEMDKVYHLSDREDNRQEGEGLKEGMTTPVAEFSRPLPEEENHLAISSYGELSFFDLKGLIEAILDHAGIVDREFVAAGPAYLHPGRKAVIRSGETEIGFFGEMHPKAEKAMDLPGRVLVAELSMDAINDLRNGMIHYNPLPKFPGSERDLALVVDQKVPAGEVEKVIRSHGEGILESVRLFDVYEGEQVEEGKKSLAYSLFFRLPDRTLKDEDITPVIDAILNELSETFGAKLRD